MNFKLLSFGCWCTIIQSLAGGATYHLSARIETRSSVTSRINKDGAKRAATLSQNDLKMSRLCRKFFNLLNNVSDVRQFLKQAHPKHECLIMAACNLRSANSETRCPALRNEIGTCFPETNGNETAATPCPANLNNVFYDTSENVTRDCFQNGSWKEIADYRKCRPILEKDIACDSITSFYETENSMRKKTPIPCRSWDFLVYLSLAGRIVSIISLLGAFLLFWLLRSIRCRRNIIHWNLTVSLILKNVFWILRIFTISYDTRKESEIFCKLLMAFYHCTHLSTFFWMLVEGIHLHIMIAVVYNRNEMKLLHYLLIGWGSPSLITCLWVIWKIANEHDSCWMKDSQFSPGYLITAIPIYIIIVVNTGILGNIIRILITKLKAEANENLTRFCKAIKAALFLLPLLGGTYLIFLISPEKNSIGEQIFLYFNTFLQSFQGFFVCIIYCFANAEVRTAISKQAKKWSWYNQWKYVHGKEIRKSSVCVSTTYSTAQVRFTKVVDEGKCAGTILKTSSTSKLITDETKPPKTAFLVQRLDRYQSDML